MSYFPSLVCSLKHHGFRAENDGHLADVALALGMLNTSGLGHHRVLKRCRTIRAALAHILGALIGEKLLVAHADLQDALA